MNIQLNIHILKKIVHSTVKLPNSFIFNLSYKLNSKRKENKPEQNKNSIQKDYCITGNRKKITFPRKLASEWIPWEKIWNLAEVSGWNRFHRNVASVLPGSSTFYPSWSKDTGWQTGGRRKKISEEEERW